MLFHTKSSTFLYFVSSKITQKYFWCSFQGPYLAVHVLLIEYMEHRPMSISNDKGGCPNALKNAAHLSQKKPFTVFKVQQTQ